MANIIVRMKKQVYSDIPFLSENGERLIAEKGKVYEAEAGTFGAICVILPNGKLGVKHNEFEFINAPVWVLEKHGLFADIIGKDITL